MNAVNLVRALSILAALSGIVAAYYGWKASRVKISPTWDVEPGDVALSQAGWTAGILGATIQTGPLNKKARIAGGTSAILSFFAAIASFFLTLN